MSDRRFTDKPALNPEAVRGLPPTHPAMIEKRTLFPSTVVDVTAKEPDNLLVSGFNNRKIGKTVEKGRFKGYAIYMLSLEERATCPSDCDMLAHCYGNGMQMARRHRIADSDVFYDRLEREIADLSASNAGVLIRLHVLGDFPSVEYVYFWKDILDAFANVACFGYTHRRTRNWDGDEIGDAIDVLKEQHPERFRIRWSFSEARPDGATVLNYVPVSSRSGGKLVCPSQTDATACCATCGLCWEPSFRQECIAFIKHGPKSAEAMIESMQAGDEQEGEKRAVRPIPVSGLSPSALKSAKPEFIEVDPSTLTVETKYQRDLSAKSLKLIKRIVEHFSWAKFKPPVCVRQGSEIFVIDGQHTAIGAASHPDIDRIPVMIVDAGTVAARADSFVAHNRDRVAMSPYQVFHGEVAAQDSEALAINRAVLAGGGSVPRHPPSGGKYKIGHISGVSRLQRVFKAHGASVVTRAVDIGVRGRCAPISATILSAITALLTREEYREVDREDVVTALLASPDFEKSAQRLASELNIGRDQAAIVLLYRSTSALRSGRAA